MLVRTIRGLVAASLFVAVATTVSEAQMESSSRFGINAGISSPLGDFGDFADLGFTAGAQFTHALNERFRLRLNVDYGRYGFPDGVDGNWSLIGGMANIVIPITTGSGFKPYVLGGVGMSNVKADFGTGGEESQTKVAFNGGGGYEFGMGSRTWQVEIKYVSVALEGTPLTYVPITLGLKF